MRHIVLLGRFTGDYSEEPHVLYCGLDGQKSLKAARDACATGKYKDGGKIFEIRNVPGRPFPVVPITPKPANVLGPFKQTIGDNAENPQSPSSKPDGKPKKQNQSKQPKEP